MVALQIRDVTSEIHDALAAEAQRRELTMQAFLFEVLEREARASRNRTALERAHERAIRRGVGATREQIITAIDQGRRARSA